MENFQNILGSQRFEIQTIGRIIVGRHRFGITVDHDRFITRVRQREAGMNAAIIKLDPLPNTIWSAAQYDNLFTIGWLALAFRHTKAWRLISRIHIWRFRLELRSAGINPLEHRSHT